jgi:predicted amidophosphoribosyltransferase
VRDTRPQAGLKRAARQQNVKNAFACNTGQANLRGLRIALVDDVMTTGATMSEAARALKKAGARSVDAWALARALQHR